MDREAERAHARLVLDAFGLGDSNVTAASWANESSWQVAVRLPGHTDFGFALRADGTWVVAPPGTTSDNVRFWSNPKGVEFPTLQQAIVHRLYLDSVTE